MQVGKTLRSIASDIGYGSLLEMSTSRFFFFSFFFFSNFYRLFEEVYLLLSLRIPV